MRIAVVGCGAMGSIYATLLASSGQDVFVVDRNEERIRLINRDGLRVEGISGDRTVRIRAFMHAPAKTVDIVIVAVKAAHVEAAGDGLAGLIGPDTVILTIQNGLGSASTLAEVVGIDRVAVGIAGGFGAIMRGPAHAFHSGMEAIRIGAFAGLEPERLEPVVAAWNAAGFKAEMVSDIVVMQWEKLICNVAYSAPCTLTGLTVGEVIADPEIGAISRAAAEEAWRIGIACGVAIKVKDPVEHALAFGLRIPNAKPSMLQDHENHRPSEIDAINGAVPREAAKAGLSAPVNVTLTNLVKQRERAFARGAEKARPSQIKDF